MFRENTVTRVGSRESSLEVQGSGVYEHLKTLLKVAALSCRVYMCILA